MIKKVRILLVFVCMAFLFVPMMTGYTLGAQQEARYVASESGERYHTLECSAVKRIKADNRVTFHSVHEAVEAGYSPCKVCKPPEAD